MQTLAQLSFEMAAPDDVATILALESKMRNPRIYAPTLDLEGVLRTITGNYCYLIKRDGVAVGTAAYRIEPDGSFYINSVNIDPAFHRQGIARKAMEFLLAKTGDIPRVTLVTHPENEAAISLYTSLGFAIEDRRENFFGDGEPRLVLERRK